MVNIVSFICAILGYLLFFLTEMLWFPVLLIAAGFVMALADLVLLYSREKLQFGDFIKEAFNSKWGSSIAFIAGIIFIILVATV